jgi:hypothetical protein
MARVTEGKHPTIGPDQPVALPIGGRTDIDYYSEGMDAQLR